MNGPPTAKCLGAGQTQSSYPPWFDTPNSERLTTKEISAALSQRIQTAMSAKSELRHHDGSFFKKKLLCLGRSVVSKNYASFGEKSALFTKTKREKKFQRFVWPKPRVVYENNALKIFSTLHFPKLRFIQKNYALFLRNNACFSETTLLFWKQRFFFSNHASFSQTTLDFSGQRLDFPINASKS